MLHSFFFALILHMHVYVITKISTPAGCVSTKRQRLIIFLNLIGITINKVKILILNCTIEIINKESN